MREGDIELLQRIAEYEETLDWSKPGMELGWEWRDVRAWIPSSAALMGLPQRLNRLFQEGFLDNPFKSNSYTGYRLSDKGSQTVTSLEQLGDQQLPERVELPDDVFGDIIGHDDTKELLRACISADRPVHVLLAGPPALAKTLFLWEIEQALGEQAVWLVGSAASKAGLWDLVVLKRPRVVLVDELDKMNAADTAALLSMMEGGRLVRAKKGRELEISYQIWVIAATNRIHGLSPELLSRFAVRKVTPYNRADYKAVVIGVLVHREGVSADMAEEIAQRLSGMSQDVRDAVRVARLAPQLGVEKSIELLLGE
jgi:Holliday junction DNA helicase RuvB